MTNAKPLNRILIVDDEPENLKAIRRELHLWMSKRGVTVDTCESGEEALSLMEQKDYAVLITDNRMPGISGTELVKRVGREYPTTVSMILTGYTEKHDIEGALSAGIFAFLVKPWDREDLRREVDKAMEVHYSRARHRMNSERINEELRMAVEFQKQLLAVDPPAVNNGTSLEWVQEAAGRMGVIGDYLDFVQLSESRYLVLLGDVSGHGLRTTFVSAMLKAVLTPKYIAENGGDDLSPADLLGWINREVVEFTEQFPDLFIAFSACLVDTERRQLTISSAGNPLPLLHRGNQIRPVEIYGVALGVNGEAEYQETTVQLAAGESLYLFTDGIHMPERGKDRVTRDTLLEAILEVRWLEPLETLLERLKNRGRAEELGDDLTLLRISVE